MLIYISVRKEEEEKKFSKKEEREKFVLYFLSIEYHSIFVCLPYTRWREKKWNLYPIHLQTFDTHLLKKH
jgi:hypothetical protein